ncbi:MAG: hypothetical protein P4L81_00025, partial [Candidatus Pacebacteria bacterium]|nr:hypothetical protein [Candidatus Paceibacterota bacterium]
MKWHQVRKNTIVGLLQFFQRHNRHYNHVVLDDGQLHALPVRGSFIDLQGDVIDASQGGAIPDAPQPIGASSASDSAASATAAP